MDIFTRTVTGILPRPWMRPSRDSRSVCAFFTRFTTRPPGWRNARSTQNGLFPACPTTIHVDNGADFRSRNFERACRDEGIALIWREPGEPRYGGHIERLIGTQMGAVHLLPGTTFSSIAERGDYDFNTSATLTLRELERDTSALKSRAAIINQFIRD